MERGTVHDRVVVLIDDDDSVRRALARRLRLAGNVVEAFDTAAAFLARRHEIAAGCIVTDLQMPGMDGLQLQAALAQSDGDVPMVFISGHGDLPTGVAAMRAGAVHFLQKPFPDDALLAAVSEALAIAARRRTERAVQSDAARAYATLTPRERDVHGLVVQGLMNKVIANQLGVAEKTVKIHRARMMTKMGVRSVADLVRKSASLSRGREGRGA